MDYENIILLLPIILLIGGAFQYLLNMFYHKDENSYLYMLCCLVGFALYFLKDSYIFSISASFYVFLLFLFVTKYTHGFSRVFKIFFMSLAFVLLFLLDSSALKEELVASMYILFSFLALPATSRNGLNVNNFALLKTTHFVFRLILVFLSIYTGFAYEPSLTIITLITVSYVIFSLWFHRSYNKSNEELFLSLFLILIVFCCSISPLVLFSYILLLYISEYRMLNFYSHHFDSLSMTTWLSPTGVKTIASFYILFQSLASLETKYVLFLLLVLGVTFSTYRTNTERDVNTNDNKNFYYQKVLWALLAVFLLLEGSYVL